MWLLVMNSNYFEIVSTVTFLVSQTELISGMFLFKTVLLYLIYLYNDYTRYNICSAWFLDIVIYGGREGSTAAALKNPRGKCRIHAAKCKIRVAKCKSRAASAKAARQVYKPRGKV